MFTVAVLVTLTLGIGTTTVMFTLVDTMLLRPLPYAEPERLVVVWPGQAFNVSMVRHVAERVPALSMVSGMATSTATALGDGGPPEQVQIAEVSASHFDLLGVHPALGSGFAAEHERPGAGGVVVLSHELWLRRFGGDSTIVGRTVRLAGRGHETRTVLGVMPRGFRMVGQASVAAWVPLGIPPGVGPGSDPTWYVASVIGRLAPGATAAQANAQLRNLAETLRPELNAVVNETSVRTAVVQPLEAQRRQGTGTLWLLFGAASLVLLIACANVANLLLARGEARVRELALRGAIGATSGRLARQLLTEAGVLAIAGGAGGVLLAHTVLPLAVAGLPATAPDARLVAIDGRVLLFAIGVTFLAALISGALPARRGSGAAANAALRQGWRGSAGAQPRVVVSRALIAFQMAVSVVLVIGSTLMLRTLGRLVEVDPGFRPEGVLVLRPSPPPGVRGPETFLRFYADVLERVRAIPQVRSAGSALFLPMNPSSWAFPTFVEGHEGSIGGDLPSIDYRVVTAGYFETLGMGLVAGRVLSADDRREAPRVAVINQALARRFWPDGEAIGRLLRPFSPGAEGFRVVGVVEDVRQTALAVPPRPAMYVADEQLGWGLQPGSAETALWLMVRVRGRDPMDAAPAIRAAIWSVDRDTPIDGLDPLNAVVRRSTAPTQYLTTLLAAFALLALALAAVGVYGVTAYTVASRLPEFGVRLALGAHRRDVLWAALSRGIGPALGGVVAGTMAAAGGSRLLRSALFGVQPLDPATFAAVPLLLGLIALGAIVVPARRATRVNPVDALRHE
jgi:predicted permease